MVNCTRVVLAIGVAPALISFYGDVFDSSYKDHEAPLPELLSPDGAPRESPIVALAEFCREYICYLIKGGLWLIKADDAPARRDLEEPFFIKAPLVDVWLSFDRNALNTSTRQLLDWVRPRPNADKKELYEKLSVIRVEDRNSGTIYSAKTNEALNRFHFAIFDTKIYKEFSSWPSAEPIAGGPDQGDHVLRVSTWADFDGNTVLSAMKANLSDANNTQRGHHYVVSCRVQEVWQFRPADMRVGLHGYQSAALGLVKQLISNILYDQLTLFSRFDEVFTDSYTGHQVNKRVSFNNCSDFTAMMLLLLRIVQDMEFKPTYVLIGDIGKQHNSTEDWHKVPTAETLQIMGLIATVTKVCRNIRWILTMDDTHWEHFSQILASSAPGKRHQTLRIDATFFKGSFEDAVRWHMAQKMAINRLQKYDSWRSRNEIREDPLFTAEEVQVESEMPRKLDVSTMAWVEVASYVLQFQRNCPQCDFPFYMSYLAEHCPTLEDLYAWSLSSAFDHHVVPSLPNQSTAPVRPPLNSSASYYETLLVVTGVAYRALTLAELAALSQLPRWVDPSDVIQNALLTVLSRRHRGKLRFAVYDSPNARMYAARLFPRFPGPVSGCSVHVEMARRCLCLLLGKLHCTHDGFSEHAHDMTDNPVPIGYSVYMWLQHLLDATCCDSHHPDVLKMAEHVLSLHLPDWLAEIGWDRDAIGDCLALLRRFLEAIPDTFATAKDMNCRAADDDEQNDDIAYDPDAFLGTVRLLREAVSILLWHDKMAQARELSRLEQQTTKQAEEDNIADVESIKASLSEKLLFTPGFDLLKRDMFPNTLPWLAVPPILATDAVSNSCMHDIKHANVVRGCCFSPDGKLVASACDDRRIRLWSTETGLLQHSFIAFDYSLPVQGVSMVPKDGPSTTSSGTWGHSQESLIAAYTQAEMKVWDTLSGQDLFSVGTSYTHIKSMAVSAHRNSLATATGDGLLMWDYRGPRALIGSYNSTETDFVVFSLNGQWMASAGKQSIAVRSIQPGASTKFELPPPKENTEATSSDTSKDKSGKIDIPDGHMEPITCLAFSPDARYLASGSDDLTVRVWDLEARRTVVILFYHSRTITSVAFSPGGLCLVVASADSFISIWMADESGSWFGLDSSPDDGIPPSPNIRTCPNRVLSDETTGRITSLSIAPYSPSLSAQKAFPFFRLASTSYDFHLRVWDIDISTLGDRENRILVEPSPHKYIDFGGTPPRIDTDRTSVTSMAISPKGDIAATGHYNGMLCLWSTTTGERLLSSTPGTCYSFRVTCILFSPDGLQLATVGQNFGSSEYVVCVWNVPSVPPNPRKATPGASRDNTTTGPVMVSLPPSTSSSSQHSPSSTGPVPNASMCPRLIYSPHYISIDNISFSYDSRLLAALGSNGHALVFDVVDGKTIKVDGTSTDIMCTRSEHCLDIYEEQYALRCCAFSPDGEYLFVGTGVGYLLQWSLADRGLVRHPENMEYLHLYAFTAVTFSSDGSTVVAQLDTGRLIHFGIWTMDRSEGAKRLLIRHKIVRCTLNMPWEDCQIRVDVENFPGIIFTEHGAICADITGNTEITDIPKAGTIQFHYRTLPDQYPVASLNTEEGRKVLEDGSDWTLPFCGVYDDVFRWNDESIPLPAYLKPKRGGFKWCVQGRVVMVACKGGLMIFHASDDALPTRRDTLIPQPGIVDPSDSSSMSDS